MCVPYDNVPIYPASADSSLSNTREQSKTSRHGVSCGNFENPHVESVSITRCHIVNMTCDSAMAQSSGGSLKLLGAVVKLKMIEIRSIGGRLNLRYLSNKHCLTDVIVVFKLKPRNLRLENGHANCMCSIQHNNGPSAHTNHKLRRLTAMAENNITLYVNGIAIIVCHSRVDNYKYEPFV